MEFTSTLSKIPENKECITIISTNDALIPKQIEVRAKDSVETKKKYLKLKIVQSSAKLYSMYQTLINKKRIQWMKPTNVP